MCITTFLGEIMSELEIREHESDDESPQLSMATLAALNEFLTEKNAREERLRTIAEAAANGDNDLNDIDLDEDWVLI